MNTMNMPGFTGEASLYKTSGHYRIVGTPDDLLGSRGVLPQLYTTRAVCRACGCTLSEVACDCGQGESASAKLDCIRNGGPTRAAWWGIEDDILRGKFA